MSSRPDADRCPGILRPHPAVDGAVLRIRIPGGRITPPALATVAAASGEYADGDVQLTARANLQLRGVRTASDGVAPAGLVRALGDAGLLPHPTHERVRNIVCSPLTGRAGGRADLRGLVDELDVTVCGLPPLAALPGPFLFALDDGRGDLNVERADLAAVAVAADRVRIWAGGVPGPVVPLTAAVPTLTGLALEFGRLAPSTERPCWHVRELPGGGHGLFGGDVGPTAGPPTRSSLPLGVLPQDDGRAAVSVLAPLGRLTQSQVSALVESGARDLVATPWRGVVVPDLVDGPGVASRLAAAGLVVDDASPWRGVTACPGARCGRGQGDTEALARLVVGASNGRGLPVHVVACARACGRPSRRHVLATVGRGLVEIDGEQHRPADAAAVIADRRAEDRR